MADTIETRISMPSVELNKGIRKTFFETLFVTGNKKAHRIDVPLLRNGQPVSIPSGAKVEGYLTRYADDVTVRNPGTASGNVVSVTLEKGCYAKTGAFALTIQVTVDGVTNTVFWGESSIFSSTAETIIDGDYIIYDLAELLKRIDAMKEATKAAETATTNANNATKTANTAATNADNATKAANTATTNANNATKTANTATTNADNATKTANTAAEKINNMTVQVSGLEAGATPTANLELVDGHYNLSFAIPKGDKGNTGATGATPKITVKVVTGEPGTDASVSQSGTAEAPIITLTIPRGDTGSLGNLTICGKAPDAEGKVMLTAADVGALSGTDVTLAIAGEAADAKATGDALNQLKDDKLDKTETAANSNKLGGKGPEYYLRPPNLLDNGNFTYPVNQRGQTTYEGGWSWSIDRWYLGHSAVNTGGIASMTLTSGGILIKNVKTAGDGYSYIQTRIAGQRIAEGKAYTFAYKRNGEIVIVALAADYIAGQVSQYGFLPLLIENSGVNEATFEWAALYEGTYSADTLPPYVAKEYAAEWMECRRYTQKITLGGVAKATYIGCVVPLSPPMRISPTITPDGDIKVTGGETVEIVTGGASATADYIQMDATLKRNDVSWWRADYWLTAEL